MSHHNKNERETLATITHFYTVKTGDIRVSQQEKDALPNSTEIADAYHMAAADCLKRASKIIAPLISKFKKGEHPRWHPDDSAKLIYLARVFSEKAYIVLNDPLQFRAECDKILRYRHDINPEEDIAHRIGPNRDVIWLFVQYKDAYQHLPKPA